MNTNTFSCRILATVLPIVFVLGCDGDASPKKSQVEKPDPNLVSGKKVPVGGPKSNVFLEIQEGGKRRVLVNAYVCRRTDQLEQFLCRKFTKEHEAILAAELNARDIHTALLLAQAEPGSPVQFRPYKPAHGAKIKIYVQYKNKDGKEVVEAAQRWIKNVKTKKDLEYDWVFAGSREMANPFDKDQPAKYMANDGDVICLSNFDTALLDLPVQLTAVNDDLTYEAHTERIPAVNTPVTVILEPVFEPKKK